MTTPTTPDPTAGELLADANLIILLTATTTPNPNAAADHWRHRYQQWLTKQNHPANRGGAV